MSEKTTVNALWWGDPLTRLAARGLIRFAPSFPSETEFSSLPFSGALLLERFSRDVATPIDQVAVLGGLCGLGALVGVSVALPRREESFGKICRIVLIIFFLSGLVLHVRFSSLRAAPVVGLIDTLERALESVTKSLADLCEGVPRDLAEVRRSAPGADGRSVLTVIRDIRDGSAAMAAFARDLLVVVPVLVKLIGALLLYAARARKLALVSSCWAVVVSASFGGLAYYAKRRRCLRCRGCARVVGLSLSAPLALVLAEQAKAELAHSLIAASFCRDTEQNVVLLARWGRGGALTYNATRYYIAGEGENPVSKQLSVALEVVGRIRRRASASLAMSRAQPLQARLGRLHQSLAHLDETLSRAAVRSFFDALLGDATCERYVGTTAWAAFLHALLGAVFLPWLTLGAVRFLEGRSARSEGPAAALASPAQPEVQLVQP